MSKGFLIIAAAIGLVLGHGCERASLFDSDQPAPIQNSGIGPSGEIVVDVEVQGGFAGVHRDFTVCENGYARYVDYAAGGGQTDRMLSPDEYHALVAYFLEKDFFNLDGNYFEANVADAMRFAIQFRHGGREKKVGTDGLHVPQNLLDLLTHLNEIIDDLNHHALQLDFRMDRQSLLPGQFVNLSLTITNSQTKTIQLASGVQRFEFFALPATMAPLPPLDSPTAYAWNYTYGKVYIMLMQYTTLAPGASLIFQAQWDGIGNNGARLEGAYLVGARALTSPGGGTPLQPLQISK